MTAVGSSVERARDLELVTGRGRFVADVDRPGQLHARIVRSPLARARLIGVGTEAAAAAARCRRGGHRARRAGRAHPDPDSRSLPPPTPRPVLQPLLARDVVRYVGEPVAVVVAEDPWSAEDAAELVELELEPGPESAVVDPVEAATHGAPLVHVELGSNVVDVLPSEVRRRRGRVRRRGRGRSAASRGGAPHGRSARDARSRRRARSRDGPPHGLGRGEGEALQPRGHGRPARSRSGVRAPGRGRRRRRVRCAG